MKKLSWSLIVLIITVTSISIVNNRTKDPQFLDDQLSEIEHYFKHRKSFNKSVSHADVAWHLDHSLKSINSICESVASSNPEALEQRFNLQRIFVHTTGYIPRGAAQAPASVKPPQTVQLDSLKLQLALVYDNLERLATLDTHTYFNHPVFGHLDRDQTRRFLEIHTNHHLKIIEDILAP
ncbi:MAG: DUF1569 domain-containing protein [Bacteroidota bacterium]